MDEENEQDFIVKLWSRREESYERPDHRYDLELGEGGLKIPFPNTFAFSLPAYSGRLRPFSSELVVHDSRTARLGISNLALKEFDDLLADYAQEHYIAFDVSPAFMYDPDTRGLLPLGRIVEEVDVDCHVLDEHLIRISKPEYAKLIRSFPHFEFRVLDPTEAEDDELRRMYEVATGYDPKEPVLGKLESPTVYIDSHGDDSLWLEARDVSFLRRVFERTLQTYVGTHYLMMYDLRPEISWVPEEVMERILPAGSAFTTTCSHHLIKGDTLIMHHSDTVLVGPTDRYEFNYAGTVEYDFETGEWRLPPKRL